MKWILLILGLIPALSFASQTLEYTSKEAVMEGAISYPDTNKKAPVVLIVHDWNGLDAYEAGRADQIAKLGYVGFAIDIYGKGVRPTTPKDCATEAGKYYQNPKLLLERINAAVEAIRNNPRIDSDRIVIMGYCFGGSASLNYARSGAPILGAVSFHGGLKTSQPVSPGVIKGKILVLHGDADTAAPMADVEALKKELKDAKVNFKVVIYKGAKHAFTVPGSEKMGNPGVGYDEKADKASWKELVSFLKKTMKV